MDFSEYVRLVIEYLRFAMAVSLGYSFEHFMDTLSIDEYIFGSMI